MIKTRTWIIIISSILVLCTLLALALVLLNNSGTVANVYVDGECVLSVDVSKPDSEFEERIETENGYNIVRFEAGRVCVIDADCKDGICVNTGWISGTFKPIVCLPHKVVVKIEKEHALYKEEIDSVVY